MSEIWLFITRHIYEVNDLFIWLIDEVGQALAWIIVLNAVISIVMSVWFYRRARRENRSRLFWTIYGPLLGMVMGFFTPMFALSVKHRCEFRKEQGRLWFVLASIFPIPSAYACYIINDARNRQIRTTLAVLLTVLAGMVYAGLVMLLMMFVFIDPWLVIKPVEAGTFFPGSPGLPIAYLPVAALLSVVLFEVIYRNTRPDLTVARVKDRLRTTGDLHPTNGDLVVVQDLVKYFPVRSGVFGTSGAHVKAVDGVSFKLKRGRTLGLVGESGCGKTTVGRLLLRLLEPTAGRVIFDGMDLSALAPAELRTVRRMMQLVFQDPFGSLNPRQTIEGIVGEALSIHGIARGRARREMVADLLKRVGLSREHLKRYPHEFSGGQRQRIGIARALALNPSLIVCDEPVSALDVSIQAQILNLLADLQDELGLTYLFIAHDLSVVEHISDEVAVMYLGKLVEHAPSADLYRKPMHPYTMALLSSIPVPDPSVVSERVLLTGDVPTPINPPPGCTFHPRCRYATAACREKCPELRELADGHFVACTRAEEIQNHNITTP